MAITAGLTLPCEIRSGGVLKLHLANADDVMSFTFTGGIYVAPNMVAGKKFYEFEFEQDTAEIRQNDSRENGSAKVSHELEFFIPKLTQTNRNRLQELLEQSSCGMLAIAEDSNNNKWVLGYSEKFLKKRPLKLSTTASTSGKAFTDLTGSTVILMSEDTSEANTFTGTIPT